MIKDELEKILGFELTATENMDFGDYTSNIAMAMFSNFQFPSSNFQSKFKIPNAKNPRELAEAIAKQLKTDKELAKLVDRIEVAGPGFINFWLTGSNLVNELERIGKEKGDYGKSTSGKGKTAIVEYSSPNIAKPFTIGHLRSTIIGDAIANLLEATGYKVYRDNHLGDWGTQFGVLLSQIGKIPNYKSQISNWTVKDLVKLYVEFHARAEEDPDLKEDARKWFMKLETGDSEARQIWQKCIEISWIEFRKIYDILGVKFSPEFEKGRGLGESFFETRMKEVIDELKDKNMLKAGEEGAKLVFFKGDQYPPLMIIKKDGATLYATRDLATDKYRKEKYDPDLIINEVGSEQTLYFRQIFETEKLLGWYKEGTRVHVGHGLIRFKEGKMSTRKGNVIWMEEVIGEAVTRAKKLGSDSTKLAEVVAIGALKYNDLKRDPKTDIVFDWDEILNMEGNSGPYLQYTVARTNSVLAKLKTQNSNLKTISQNLNPEELKILRSLVKFQETIESAAKTYSPNLLASYLYDLAQKFNTFYNKHRIIGIEDKSDESFRLALTAGTGQVLKNGLKLLGIEMPERM